MQMTEIKRSTTLSETEERNKFLNIKLHLDY